MIEGAQTSDIGVYECVARNAVGEAKAQVVKLRHSRDAVVLHDSYTGLCSPSLFVCMSVCVCVCVCVCARELTIYLNMLTLI